jgi:dihydrofolate synthase/folylpolyglutamate synthase
MPGRANLPTLDRIRALCDLMGDPQLSAPVIHVTGTNGKGSTVGIVAELLVAVGLSVGAFTSPDLTVINERITRNGEPIGDPELIEVLGSLAALEPLLDSKPTRFDLLTAAAFRWFADVAVDVAVVEVGLGGRWDATNVVEPAVAVVTNVSEDHLEVLGPTLIDVAREKAGIVKAGSLVVLGETDPGGRQCGGRERVEAGGEER